MQRMAVSPKGGENAPHHTDYTCCRLSQESHVIILKAAEDCCGKEDTRKEQTPRTASPTASHAGGGPRGGRLCRGRACFQKTVPDNEAKTCHFDFSQQRVKNVITSKRMFIDCKIMCPRLRAGAVMTHGAHF